MYAIRMPRHVTQLIILIMGESALVAGLHRASRTFPIDWTNLWDWLRFTELETSVPSLIRLIALILGYWLLGSTTTYTVALATNIPGAIRAVEWMTLPSVQRLSRKAVRVSLVATLVAPASLPLAASATESSSNFTDNEVVVVDEGVLIPPGASVPDAPETPPAPDLPPIGDAPEEKPPTYVPTPSGSADPNHAADSAAPDESQKTGTTGNRLAAAELNAQQRAEITYTVLRGDNLWDIAKRHLASMTGRTDLTDADVAPYWGHLVELNRDSIASHNPDLINPGEVIILPAIGAS